MVEIGAPRREVAAVPLEAATRVLRQPAAALALVVAVSSLLQTILGWRRPAPGYFPDEYMYAELGRSLLEHGAPLVRGEGAQFLPLLYPLLTAPAWLWDDVGLAYRSIQAFNAVAMSLAAIPVFLLARRLRLGDRLALVIAGLSVALPELLYASSTLAEAVAYPLALAAATAAVAALEQPLLRHQVAVIAFLGLAAFARLQLAALLLCYLAGVAAVGLRRRALARTIREQWLVAGVAGAATTAGVLLALRGLGLYGSIAAYGIDPAATAKGIGATVLVLTYAVGWVVVPGAFVALLLAWARPRHTAELGFAAFASTALTVLVLQAGLVGDVGTVQERYVIYGLPLVLCAFGLYIQRGWPLVRVQALLAAVAATVAAAVPLAGYAAATENTQSVVLASLHQLERLLGDVGLASLVVALGMTGLSALVLLAAWRRPRVATPLALGATLAVALAATAAAAAFYEDKRAPSREAYLPADPSWVDTAADGPVTLVALPRSSRHDLHISLFWNREVRRLVILGGGRPDAFAAATARLDGAGRVSAAGAPVGGLVLLDTHGTTALLRNGERVAAGPTKTLWRVPAEGAQLLLALSGRFYTGLLATEGRLSVWPKRPGGQVSAYFELDLSAPRGVPPVSFRLEPSTGRTIALRVHPGTTRRLRVPICSKGAWTAEHTSGVVAIVHGSLVGLRSSDPRLVDDPSACA